VNLMYEKLLDYVACPVCSRAFTLETAKKEGMHVMEGSLSCPMGHHRFPIRKGIPRFADTVQQDHSQVKDSFSSKWNARPDLGLTMGVEFTMNFLFERYTWYTRETYDRFIEGRKLILDVGSGLGRILQCHLSKTRGEVISFEISESVDVVFNNHKDMKNVHVVQADIFNLPFPRTTRFDYIIANAVLHHTRSTQVAFSKISSLLAKDGIMDTYIYRKKGPIRELVDTYLIEHTSAISENECWEFCRAITDLGKELSKYKEPLVIGKDIPVLGIKAGSYNLQRFFFYEIMKCFWNNDIDYDFSLMTNYDWYRPKYSHRHTSDEFIDWCRDLDLSVKEMNVIPAGLAFQVTRG